MSGQYFSWPVSILFSTKTSGVILWIPLVNFAFAGWHWLSTTFLPGTSCSYKGRKCGQSQTSFSWNETKTCLSGNTCYWFKCLFTLTLKTSWSSKKGGTWKRTDSWERSVLHGLRILICKRTELRQPCLVESWWGNRKLGHRIQLLSDVKPNAQQV